MLADDGDIGCSCKHIKSKRCGRVIHPAVLTDVTHSGGPAGAVYGFLFVWAGVAATFVVLAELASMYEMICLLDISTETNRSIGHQHLEGSTIGHPC